jgi:hypothetical protein
VCQPHLVVMPSSCTVWPITMRRAPTAASTSVSSAHTSPVGMHSLPGGGSLVTWTHTGCHQLDVYQTAAE